MPRSFRAASPLKRVSLLLLVLRVVEGLSAYGYDAVLYRPPRPPSIAASLRFGSSCYAVLPVARLFDRHYAGGGQSKAYAPISAQSNQPVGSRTDRPRFRVAHDVSNRAS